jgi:hypothetical protein
MVRGVTNGLGTVVSTALLGSLLACRMANPAFDENETENNLDHAELAEAEGVEAEGVEAEGVEAEAEGQTGDGDPTTTGDGDPTTTGDGDPTTTGDGDPTTTGDGDPTTTGDGDGDPPLLDMMVGDGDGDGDPIPFDMMAIDLCPAVMGESACELCAADKCCVPGIESCFIADTDCNCLLECTNNQMSLMECAGPNSCNTGDAAFDVANCLAINCANQC